MFDLHPLTRSGLALAGVAGAAGALGLIGMGGARAATPSAQDQAFVTSNAQSNLAEISLGQLGEARGVDAATKQLAEVTLRDHQALETKLAAYAKADGLTIPATPNALQLQTAATLKATPSDAFDAAYAKAEVMGHQLAIAAATTETTAGSDPTVVSYAKAYIPIATGHLDMAEAEVAALAGVAPTSVSAGSGGRAQTDVAGSDDWIGGLAGGVVLAAAGVAWRTRRRAGLTRS